MKTRRIFPSKVPASQHPIWKSWASNCKVILMKIAEIYASNYIVNTLQNDFPDIIEPKFEVLLFQGFSKIWNFKTKEGEVF
jgi:hypothetical protein